MSTTASTNGKPPVILRHEFIEHALRKLSPRAVTVLLAILSHVDGDRRAYPGLVRIGELAGANWRSAKRAVKELEAAGWITCEHRAGTSTRYRVSERVTARGAAPITPPDDRDVNSDRGEVETPANSDRGTPDTFDRGTPVKSAHKNQEPVNQEPKNQEPPKSPKGKETIEFPAELDNDEFRTAWNEWLAYRREYKPKPLPCTPRTLKAQLKKLAALGTAGAVAEIENSIVRGWQSVCYPDRSNSNGSGRRPFQTGDGGMRGGAMGTQSPSRRHDRDAVYESR